MTVEDTYDDHGEMFPLLREACEWLLRQRRFHDAQALIEVEAMRLTEYAQGQHIVAVAMDYVVPKLERR